jgi:FMN reductase (NADPH)
MNSTIELLKQHRSVRKFKPDALSDEQFKQIVEAAQLASTSSNMQAYSVIAVRIPETKQQLARLAANQAYIEECPLFLVWCADLHRLQIAANVYEEEEIELPSSTEIFVIATIDTALAAQNAAVAAESLGLGIVYIGGIRDNPKEVSKLLGLPKFVYPVFGMCVGFPDQEPTQRPRLPLETIVHEERYSTEAFASGIEAYNASIHQFLLTRAGGNRDSNWSKEMAARLRGRKREHLRLFLEEQGFKLQ